ncbi:MAG: radical SAM protein [Pirellulaceae bacterium]
MHQILKQTTSLCPVCLDSVRAEVRQVGDEIQLHRQCPAHGTFAAVINSHSRHYHLSAGADSSCASGSSLPLVDTATTCCSGGQCGTSMDNLSTCIGLIEIVNSCNMACPVCFADSPQERHVDAISFEEFCDRINAVTERKGMIDILQLSGGEPTIHPEFFRVLEWALANPQIGHVLLNTNGIKLTSESFFEQLTTLRQRFQKLEIYLQFDGLQAAGQVELRGADMRKTRETVIANCQKAGIPVNLAMTVDEHNREHIGDVLRLAMASPGVSGITWQPMFGSGRAYAGFNAAANDLVPLTSATTSIEWPPIRRLNVSDIIVAAVEQSDGVLCEADFTPLPCGDPNCHTVAYLLRRGDELVGLSKLIDLTAVQGFLKDRLNYNTEDLIRCGCESEPLGSILKQLEIGPESVLRLVIKPFMDAWTFDQHRTDRCCVHVIGVGGKLESFCRYYALSK